MLFKTSSCEPLAANPLSIVVKRLKIINQDRKPNFLGDNLMGTVK